MTITVELAPDFQPQESVLLTEYGIDPAQAAVLRANLASFAEDWNHTQMDIYNDYDDAKGRIEAKTRLAVVKRSIVA